MPTSLTNETASIRTTFTIAPSVAGDFSTATDNMVYSTPYNFTFGATAALVNNSKYATYAVAKSSTVTVDLTVLVNAFAQTFAFTSVKAIMLVNTGTVDINVEGTWVGWREAAGNHEVIKPGDVLLRTATLGWAVAAGETITFTNASATTAGEIDMILLGVS
jgi:hypothetical protein